MDVLELRSLSEVVGQLDRSVSERVSKLEQSVDGRLTEISASLAEIVASLRPSPGAPCGRAEPHGRGAASRQRRLSLPAAPPDGWSQRVSCCSRCSDCSEAELSILRSPAPSQPRLRAGSLCESMRTDRLREEMNADKDIEELLARLHKEEKDLQAHHGAEVSAAGHDPISKHLP